MKNKLNRKRKYFEIEQNQSSQEEEDNINKIKEKKESDSEVSIRKDEIQHKDEGSCEESEKKRRRKRYKKNIDKNSEINLSNPIAQTKNLLLKIDEKVTSNEEFADESKSDNEDSYYEVDISKVEKNEMDININRDYLQDFNDRIEDNDSSSGIFKDYFRVKSDTNANCLFSSLSLAISWGEISPNEIRQLICDYIEQNKEFFLQYEERVSDIDKYIRNMRKDKVWGEDIEIEAFSQIFNVNVTVFINKLDSTKKVEFSHPKYTETISLFLDMKFRHFDFLLPKLSSFQDIKNKKFKQVKKNKNRPVRKSEFIASWENDEEIKASSLHFDNSFPSYELANNLKDVYYDEIFNYLKNPLDKKYPERLKKELDLTKNEDKLKYQYRKNDFRKKIKEHGWEKFKIYEDKSYNRTYLLVLHTRDVDEDIYNKIKEDLLIKINNKMHQDIFEEFPLLDTKNLNHFKVGFYKILPRNNEALEFLEKGHKSINSHLGGTRTYQFLKNTLNCMWPNMKEIWIEYAKNCDKCQLHIKKKEKSESI